jgi:hypothetical protein
VDDAGDWRGRSPLLGGFRRDNPARNMSRASFRATCAGEAWRRRQILEDGVTKRFLHGAMAALSIALPAAAQTDPYAAEQSAGYVARRDGIVMIAQRAGFAEGCAVIRHDGAEAIVVSSLITWLNNLGREELLTGDQQPVRDFPRFWPMLQAAKQRGMAESASEGCGFWHANPEAVVAIRQLLPEMRR